MPKVILICGKICSGKSHYARMLRAEHPAVILSIDEATCALIENEQDDFYNVFAARVNRYLRKKAVEIVRAGADVILDWGFWSRAERTELSAELTRCGIAFAWHYIDISDADLAQNIAARNAKIAAGSGGTDFYVDEGLLCKCSSLFEPPQRAEMDVWYSFSAAQNKAP